jgi:hypothetical protein
MVGHRGEGVLQRRAHADEQRRSDGSGPPDSGTAVHDQPFAFFQPTLKLVEERSNIV